MPHFAAPLADWSEARPLLPGCAPNIADLCALFLSPFGKIHRWYFCLQLSPWTLPYSHSLSMEVLFAYQLCCPRTGAPGQGVT